MQKPLADLIRPETLEDMVGQSHLLSKGSTFRNMTGIDHFSKCTAFG